jgi:uncharacterized surface protein with fasciclin (FAS1) repeats
MKKNTTKMMAAMATLALTAAACGSDDPVAEAPVETEAGPTGELCAAVPEDGEGSFAGMTDDPAATAASNNPALSTLVAAVTEAGLVDTLNGDGPFTIFAPANPAFEALGDEAVAAVLADQDLLTSILTLHVVAGQQLSSTDLAGMDSVETLNGDITLEATDGGLLVNGQATVGCADVQTANATVHIIDAVLMPAADDAMDEEAMDEGAMEEDAMEEDAMEDMDEVALEPSGELCAAVPADGEGSFAGMTDDPAATAASNNPALSTLVAAVTEAGLVDTLNSDGPFTIFAPANPAFEALGDEAVAAVLADQDLLTSILTLHVVAGEQLSSTDLAELDSVTTVNGQDITFNVDGDSLIVNGQATVGCADVQTANATVHIIDAVLMPAADGAMDEGAMEAVGPTGELCAAVPADGEGSFAGMTDDPAATAASNNPALSTLVTAVVEAGLVDTLNSDGPFTIFAPANPAFEALPDGTLEAVLADTDLLTSILTLHVVAGEQLSSADLAELDSVTTVNGQDITIEITDAGLSVNGQATVGCADVQTANATVHIIDGVLLPA